MRVIAWPAFANRGKNPYNSLLYEHVQAQGVDVEEWGITRALKRRYDVWHLHWPDAFLNRRRTAVAILKSLAVLATMQLLRARGTRIVWTAHNIYSHERLHPRFERWFWRAFVKRLDGYQSLTETARQALEDAHPWLRRLPSVVIPHGHYRDVYPSDMSVREARAALGLLANEFAYVFVGQVRAYKNLPALVTAFSSLRDSSARLILAGSPESERDARALHALAAADSRIRLDLHFVPDREIQLYLRAADLVVLPYREILNTGSALLALSFDKPVLVPAAGSLLELRDLVGCDWVKTYSGDVSAKVLAEAQVWCRTRETVHRAPLEALDWNRIAAKTVESYEDFCCGTRREPTALGAQA